MRRATGSEMSFDATARQRVAPGAEEQDMPACLPLVSSSGDKRAAMQKEHRQEADAMWARYREYDDMVCDFPERKIGMPFPAAYCVLFPVEIDKDFVFVELDIDEVERFAMGLLAALPKARALTKAAEADFVTHEAICKAKGE